MDCCKPKDDNEMEEHHGKMIETDKMTEGDLMDCCKSKDDNGMGGHHNDKNMDGHRGGCCGGYKMWIVMGIIFVAIWYFQNRN